MPLLLLLLVELGESALQHLPAELYGIAVGPLDVDAPPLSRYAKFRCAHVRPHCLDF